MSSGLEILNLHAQGGMAEVYKAQATDDDGRTWNYAVKRMLPELLRDPEMMRMFVEEQRVAACLLHENIVRVYDIAHGEKSDTFIVMEFLEGRDLQQVIDAVRLLGRTIPVWLTIHVARAVLSALHYATTQARDKTGRPLALIHRDISPHNVFICNDGQVKLTDFGVARVETTEVRTRAGVIKGKFGYMSPEQLNSGELDFRSDLYNVGILIYESLTAKRLFYGESVTQFIAQMMRNDVPPLDPALRVPPELDSVMRRALSKRREERPVTALAFDAELNAIAGRYGLHATRAHVAAEMKAIFGSTMPARATVPEPSSASPVEGPPVEGPPVEGPSVEGPPVEGPPVEGRPRVLTTRAPLARDPSSSAGFGEPTEALLPVAPVPTTDPTSEVVTEPRRPAVDVGFSVALAQTEPEGRPGTSKTEVPGGHRVSTGSRKVTLIDSEEKKP